MLRCRVKLVVKMVWKGVIIEESLEDATLLDMVVEVGYSESLLEGEDEKGEMHFHEFELQDDKKDKFVYAAKNLVKQGWYLHICKEKTMIVIFNNKVFEFGEDETDKLEEARNYGLSIGIIRDQMPFENLIKDPYY